MVLQTLDWFVIGVYLVIVLSIGWVFRKKASQSTQDYLLGGKSMPWWMLGISNASGMFDISGTLWMVSILFIYGVKSVWLVWLWPVFNQIFLMVYLSGWLRKSNVSTGAEWILFRFGTGKQALISHKVIIVFALLSCLSFMAYGFIGLGKFLVFFIPFEPLQPYVPFVSNPAHFYGIVFMVIATIYAVLGGMSSIVWADIFQFALMAIGAFSIALLAYFQLENQALSIPSGWQSPFFSWELELDWTRIRPSVQQKIEQDQFSPFGLFFILMTSKGILASLAGPAPNYDMQKILATRSPREASLMSGFVNVVLLPIRYFMIAGFTVLALLYFDQLSVSNAAGELDFERLLPATMAKFAPTGLLGLFLIELIAAFMGTFAGTLNAAQAYLVQDVYQRSIKPQASPRELQRMNYLVGIGVVGISIWIGMLAQDVNSLIQWIVGALYGGYIASNLLKWHWWRFNGMGYFAGMASGILASLIFPLFFPSTLPLYYWPALFLISLLGSILGSWLSAPTDRPTLIQFYRQVNPWGWWRPIQQEVAALDPSFIPNPHAYRDARNILLGTTGQTLLTLLPIFMVIHAWPQALGCVGLLALVAIVLYFSWYRHLPSDKTDDTSW